MVPHAGPGRAIGAVAGVYAILGGSITLIGWSFDLPRLAAWGPDAISMKANAAVCAIAAGASLLLAVFAPAWRALGRSLAGLAAGVGGATLLQHATGADLGIDTLLFDEPHGARATAAPGRMGPPASTSFLLLGIGLAGLHGRGRSLAARLALAVLGICALSLVGYLYGASELFAFSRLTGIALQTATMIAGVAAGIVAAVPEHGIGAALARRDAGGEVLRRLATPIIVLPLVLGAATVQGVRAGLFDAPFAIAALALTMSAALLALVWGTARDVSRHADAARAAEQALRDGDRRKDEFLATLAHELRNPLAPLRNALHLMGLTDQPRVWQEARGMAERQVAHMVRLIDDLMDISRITRGRLQVQKQPLDLAAVLASAVETARPLLDRAGHQFTYVLPDEPCHLDGDLTRLAQVFANLLTNAARYTERGGRISLVAARAGSDLVVTVKDDGIGLSEESLSRVFEMFWQGEQPARPGREGMGVGLALVKALVELHGGTITAGSAGPGKGSAFVVRLPAREHAAHEDAAPASAARRDGSGLRILVVDDNRDSAESLQAIVRRLGSEVRTAFDGLEALETATRFRPHLILMDMGMPRLDGAGAVRRIRAEAWGADVVIYALTGWGQETDRRRSLDAGCDGHLVKPVDLPALEDLIARVAERTAARGLPVARSPLTHL